MRIVADGDDRPVPARKVSFPGNGELGGGFCLLAPAEQAALVHESQARGD